MRFAEFEDWLARLGWRLERVKGSHYHYRHVASGHRLTLSQHGRTVEREQYQRVIRDMEKLPLWRN